MQIDHTVIDTHDAKNRTFIVDFSPTRMDATLLNFNINTSIINIPPETSLTQIGLTHS